MKLPALQRHRMAVMILQQGTGLSTKEWLLEWRLGWRLACHLTTPHPHHLPCNRLNRPVAKCLPVRVPPTRSSIHHRLHARTVVINTLPTLTNLILRCQGTATTQLRVTLIRTTLLTHNTTLRCLARANIAMPTLLTPTLLPVRITRWPTHLRRVILAMRAKTSTRQFELIT